MAALPIIREQDTVEGHPGAFLVAVPVPFTVGGQQVMHSQNKYVCSVPGHGTEVLLPTTGKFRIKGYPVCRLNDPTSNGGQMKTLNTKFQVG